MIPICLHNNASKILTFLAKVVALDEWGRT